MDTQSKSGRSLQKRLRDDAGTTTGPRSILCHITYPIMLAAMVATAVSAVHYGWDFGRVNFAFLVGTIAFLALLERLIPYERDWHPSRREWGFYAIYVLLTMAGAGIAQLPVNALVSSVAMPEPVLPLWVEIPGAVLLGSLVSYGIHRLFHTHAWLWRLHGVHHVPDKVNVANNGVNHVVDIAITQCLVQLGLALVGFSHQSVFVAGLFIVLQGYFVHANIDVRLGWLNHIVAGPEQHRLHHSIDLDEAGHYSSDLSLWDRVFGSFTWYPGRKPVAVGLSDPDSFPKTGAILATLLQPWRSPKKTTPPEQAPPGD
ncbi:sterol desaturase family protein [Actinoalloteichus hymeniacidonis]|uniref:Sterol desaturase n=1 Tax=Actinoalloteichus hymeniacidonis TaxID=340345 RepID=A0AAC9HQR0_9PSEU|nr:sterol desaturase family protein [Actinoalloteichus hymeniacidonis]AOS63521.1 sterol desaturase [Actinoalloteichus hymeniacidonis]MBB5908435.1 sterol desaturase/sphingolipid hydroxylase (fatty acid hydroxylase superfamily) [Actinoalloteichus hymeniacidonis]